MAVNIFNHFTTNILRKLLPPLCSINTRRDFICFPVSLFNGLRSKYPQHNVYQIKYYAKGKDRKKDSKQKSVVINENILAEVLDVDKVKNEMDRIIMKLKEDFVKHFSIRTSLASLDTLPIEFEGSDYTLQDVAQIGKKTQSMFVLNLSAYPQLIPSVLKAIEKSGLGLNPQQDGTTLFIPVPKMTKEHRETLSKNAKAVFIKTRDNLRDVQNKYIKSSKNKEGLSDDAFFAIKDQLTKLADLRITEAENILKTKQEELKG